MTTKKYDKSTELGLVALVQGTTLSDDEKLPILWQLVLASHGTIIKAVTAICKGIDLDEREQMVLDIEIKLIEQFDRYNPEKSRVNTWISMRARCLCLDMLRANKHQYWTTLQEADNEL